MWDTQENSDKECAFHYTLEVNPRTEESAQDTIAKGEGVITSLTPETDATFTIFVDCKIYTKIILIFLEEGSALYIW